jgi:ComF family protein
MDYPGTPTGWLTRIGRAMQAALFPYRCLACDRFFFPLEKNPAPDDISLRMENSDCRERFKTLAAPFLCDQCRSTVTLLASPLCRVCGMEFKSRAGEDHTCGACLVKSQKFDMARACGHYDNGLKELIHWFKYRNLPQLARPLAALLEWGLRSYYEERPIDLMVPVPLHSKRMRSRGFNQAYLLARNAMSAAAGDGCLQKRPAIAEKLLVRIRPTLPQAGLNREMRRKNIRDAFAVMHPEQIKGKSILLVDDVYTTGATVNECARILKKAGAEWVGVLSVARAL